MTESQRTRQERRERERQQRRKSALQIVLGIIALALLLVIYGIAGAEDRRTEESQIAYWESRGVTIARW